VISKKIDENKKILEEEFNGSSDFSIYEFKSKSGKEFLVSYINNLVDPSSISQYIINNLLNYENKFDITGVVAASRITEISDMNQIIDKILNGNIAIFIEESTIAYTVELKQYEHRAIDEPNAETVIRGPKEGFVEDLNINKSMIRRKIKNKNLVFEDFTLGEQTKTRISVVYIKGIVNIGVLEEVKRRLFKINTDSILESGMIEEYIIDNPKTIYSTISNTQKPDVLAGKILEGRVAVLCDGTPHALTIPKLFIESIQTSEDYYQRPYIASLLRMVRFFSLLVSILLPGIYIALQTFHQEMIPTVFLITMSENREGVPLPAVIEATMMILMLEFLKESGTRLPRAVGSAVSIVGALVLGQASVQAGIVSAPMVIIVAVAAIAEFTIPSQREIIIYYRLFILFLGGFIGLYGITCGLIILVVQAVTQKSFGVDYGYPLTPTNKSGLKDFLVRFPMKFFKVRPEAISKQNVTRDKSRGKK
jgi:spore germination protein KA